MFESSTFCYGFLRNVVEIVLLASQHPPLPRYFADHSQRSRAERLIAFVLCGMRSSVSHLVYCILPESVFLLLAVRFCALMRCQVRVYCGYFISSWNQTGVVVENDIRFS